MDMPNRIREWRNKRGLTLEALGDRVGLSGSYIAKLEKDDRNLSIARLRQIARALQCNAADLLPLESRDDPVDQLPVGDTAGTGFAWAEQAGLHVTQWPVPLWGEGAGYSPHGCAWFGLDFLAKFNIDPKLCEVVEVRDSSMKASMPPGSVGLVDMRRTDVRHGALYCLKRGESPLVRRAHGEGPQARFEADDDTCQAIQIGRDFQMVGRVVWTARMLQAQASAA